MVRTGRPGPPGHSIGKQSLCPRRRPVLPDLAGAQIDQREYGSHPATKSGPMINGRNR